METRRLKQIAILILLALNVALLLLLGGQRLQERRQLREAEAQLRTLYQQYGLSISPAADLQQIPPSTLSLTRQDKAELALAAKLLGEQPAFYDHGSLIYRYVGQNGTLQFRSNGSVEGISLCIPTENPRDFATTLYHSLDMVVTQDLLEDQSGQITAVQTLRDIPMSGCELTLDFENGFLTQVSGCYISTEAATQLSSGRYTCATALTLLLNHYLSAGIVFQQVEGLSCLYRLQSTPDSLTLVPLWKIVTDTSTWLVDCSLNTVERTV